MLKNSHFNHIVAGVGVAIFFTLLLELCHLIVLKYWSIFFAMPNARYSKRLYLKVQSLFLVSKAVKDSITDVIQDKTLYMGCLQL